MVLGDESRLHQVVANLPATGERCVIRLGDDGPGIPAELLPRVLERFTRADTSRARAAGADGGSGLGLAIVEAIVSAHGGRIDVESAPGRTEFTIELPSAGVTSVERTIAVASR